MSPKHLDGDVVAVIPGQWITHFHTIAAYAAFVAAFLFGISLHYHKIVANQYFGYPVEWFPSVSATIGDRYPERSVFQLLIAICSGPRFLLVFLLYCLVNRKGESGAKWLAGVGIFRTLTCGGWTYVTSTDDHDWHDIFMISYLVATIPWTVGCLMLSPTNPTTSKCRRYLAGAFFGTLFPLVYFFIQHKVHRVPGAYTIYAFFEWSLVLSDVAFDAVTALDFSTFEITVRDVKGLSRGEKKRVQDVVLEEQKDKPIGQIFGAKFDWQELLDAVSDVYVGLTFWSVFTSLGPCVWYFPLWHMGISGYETALMTTISPMLLGIPPLRRLVTRYVSAVHFTSGAAGLLAYLVQSPRGRLGAVSIAVWQGCLAWTASWSGARGDPKKLEARISAFLLGLMASSIAKFACWTNNPTWPIMNAQNGGWNKTGIVCFMLAIGWAFYRQPQTTMSSVQQPTEDPKGSFAPAALGLGGLFFGLHAMLSDSSTMIAWVWEGYPVRGPLAVPHGSWTIFTMGAGLLLGLFYPNIARSWRAFGIASVGAAVVTTLHNWTGYYGALALTLYLCAMTPVLITNAVRFPPGRTFFLGFFAYNIVVLFNVWVVAYAFVPGGPLVREHTDWVMATTMIFLGCGVFSVLQNEGTPAEQKSFQPPPNPAARKQRAYYLYILLFLQLLSASIAYLRFPAYNYEPYHKDNKLITAGIWTIHFSIDNDMWSSERRMESLIRETELDLVGLLESDLQRIIMGNRDTTQYLAEQLGMWVDYGPGPDKHTWGCALLSKFPIINSTHHMLPSPVGELAPAIHATIEAYGELIDVYVFHSGQEEDPEDRRLQTEYLTTLMGQSNRPGILLSYLITRPHQGNYNTWVGEKSGMKDIDRTDWDRWCEYILYKGMRKIGYARLSRGTITDTELQVAKFIVGAPEGTGDFVPEERMPMALRFPALFRGQGVRGHRYHVFGEPRYFV
ncbi:hypothetical protein LTR08_005581 [Meristemomyces frigidus]|nr:hypothetical protein LTR08_005581 [Meristemomyces frigidus]